MNKGAQELQGILQRRKRSAPGFSARMLAQELSIGETAISRILSGERRPSLALANVIHRVLGIPQDAWDKPVTARAS